MDQPEIDLEKSTPVNVEPTESLGEWLTVQRQTKGLSTQDVVSRTNRNLRQIIALEADDYLHISSPPLLRALVRHYARAIDIDTEEAIARLPIKYQRVDPVTPAREAEVDKVFTHNGTPLKSPWISRTAMIVLLLVVLGLLAYWVFGSRLIKSVEGIKKVSEPNQVQVVTPNVATTPIAPVPTTPTTDANASATNTVVPIAEASLASPLATSGEELLLKFKATSWVEIRDADGKLLLSGEQPENTEQPISGKLPLKVKVGNAGQVDASWKGAAYDLVPFTKAGVARFNLE